MNYSKNEPIKKDHIIFESTGPKGETVTDTSVHLKDRKIVAIVGRPNVGKSSLFNSLVQNDDSIRQTKALVSSIPGTTRDRSYGKALWYGREFIVVDTGGLVGDEKESDFFTEHIRQQATLAIQEADIIIFMVDVVNGITPGDIRIAQTLRSQNKKVILVANKADNEIRRSKIVLNQFERLDLGQIFPVTTAHGEGLGDLIDEIIKDFPPNVEIEKKKTRKDKREDTEKKLEPSKPESVRIAIVGQPNVGKSSILNYILGERRAIVSEIPGTTHDPIDQTILWKGESVTLIDTAGITRQNIIAKKGLERSSTLWSLKTIEQAHVVILLIDPIKGVNNQDIHIASHIMEHHKSVILSVNKWDLLRDKPQASKNYMDHIRARLKFLDYVPVIFTSAKTGYLVESMMDLAVQIFKEREFRFSTNRLNEIVKDAVFKHPPPSRGGKGLKIKFVTQAISYPPTFVFWVNDESLVHFSYERYLENAIREQHKFLGTPLRFVFRSSQN